MVEFVKGEWVAYVPGDGRVEFGRVASVADMATASVSKS